MRRIVRAFVAVALMLVLSACGGNPFAPSGPPWTVSGSGNNVFDVPTSVSTVRVTGAFLGSSSNFIIWVGTDLLVNELLGTSWGRTSYAGTHDTAGGRGRVENSTGVTWTLTEVR